jgi:hypothetical protein
MCRLPEINVDCLSSTAYYMDADEGRTKLACRMFYKISGPTVKYAMHKNLRKPLLERITKKLWKNTKLFSSYESEYGGVGADLNPSPLA